MAEICKTLDLAILDTFEAIDEAKVKQLLFQKLSNLGRKIVVLDDDPTGTQTVHQILVYTDWEKETLLEAFEQDDSMFFILTNSRGFSVDHTRQAHKQIAENIAYASKKTGKDFILISRGDSTMRGHYPLETQVLKETLEEITDKKFDGEILCPFMKEGGRFTISDIHYVKEENKLIPAGETEFAKDKSFGYESSNLAQWVEEKTKGIYKADSVTCISLELLRAMDYKTITEKLLKVKNFEKIVCNAVDYCDIEVFISSLCDCIAQGKEFLFRSAAAIPKVLGGVSDKSLLTRKELVPKENKNGGIVLIGSHVKKTTLQLNELQNSKYPITFIEFNAHLVKVPGGLEQEVKRVIDIVEEKISNGETAAVFTSRELLNLDTSDKDKILEASVKISDAVTSIIGKLTVRPNFIVAKGGITSSDVGTKALKVKKAMVMGQVKKGIPVWMTGEESKFPHMPYVIFPGNVGENTTLKEVVEILMAE